MMNGFEPRATAIGTVKETGEQVACNYVREDVALGAIGRASRHGFIKGVIMTLVGIFAYIGFKYTKKKKKKNEKEKTPPKEEE